MSAGITMSMVGTALVGAAATGIVGSLLAPSGSSGAPASVAGAGGAPNAASAADPFAAQRGQYQTQLSQMMAPGAVFNAQDPSYAFRFNEGLTGVQRSQAAAGGTGSGAEMAAATQYGQGMASQEYGNQFSRLSQLAGGNIGSPAAAGQIMAGQQNQQQGGATAFGSTVGTAAGTAFNNWMNPAPGSQPLQTQSTSSMLQPAAGGGGGGVDMGSLFGAGSGQAWAA